MKRIACLLSLLATAVAAGAQDFKLPEKTELPIEPMALGQRADPAEESAKQLLFRTLDEYTGKCINKPVWAFNRLYMGKDKMAAVAQGTEEAAVTPEMIKEIAQKIRDRVKSGDITIQISAAVDGSAEWSATVFQGKVGGDLKIKQSDVERAIGEDRYPRSRSLLFRQEQLADSLLHETAHAFYAIFKHEYKLKPAWKPDQLTNEFTRTSYWDGTDAKPELNRFKLSGTSYNESIWPNEETARTIASSYNSIYKCDPGAVGRILGVRK